MPERPDLPRLDHARATLIEHAGTLYHPFRHRLIRQKVREINAEILLRTKRGEAQA